MNAYVKRVKTRSAWSPGTVSRGELLRIVLESVIRQLNAVDAVQIHRLVVVWLYSRTRFPFEPDIIMRNTAH